MNGDMKGIFFRDWRGDFFQGLKGIFFRDFQSWMKSRRDIWSENLVLAQAWSDRHWVSCSPGATGAFGAYPPKQSSNPKI